MTNVFFQHPILNSPYGYFRKKWGPDKDGQQSQYRRAGMSQNQPIKSVLDLFNSMSSTNNVHFTTSKALRWETEVCREAEAHAKVKAYVKNHNLGLKVPYRWGSQTRRYLPDFIVLVDDGHGRWAFAEFTDIHDIDKDFANLVESHLEQMLAPFVAQALA